MLLPKMSLPVILKLTFLDTWDGSDKKRKKLELIFCAAWADMEAYFQAI